MASLLIDVLTASKIGLRRKQQPQAHIPEAISMMQTFYSYAVPCRLVQSGQR